jgi:hypothetical protein
MKTARYLSTVFMLSFVAIFSTLSIISCTIIPPVPDVLYPVAPEDLQKVKNETLSVTGLVNLPSLGVSGSCVLVGHEGSDYYALTANHVVRHKSEW